VVAVTRRPTDPGVPSSCSRRYPLIPSDAPQARGGLGTARASLGRGGAAGVARGSYGPASSEPHRGADRWHERFLTGFSTSAKRGVGHGVGHRAGRPPLTCMFSAAATGRSQTPASPPATRGDDRIVAQQMTESPSGRLRAAILRSGSHSIVTRDGRSPAVRWLRVAVASWSSPTRGPDVAGSSASSSAWSIAPRNQRSCSRRAGHWVSRLAAAALRWCPSAQSARTSARQQVPTFAVRPHEAWRHPRSGSATRPRTRT
jgi:hypothetical protein